MSLNLRDSNTPPSLIQCVESYLNTVSRNYSDHMRLTFDSWSTWCESHGIDMAKATDIHGNAFKLHLSQRHGVGEFQSISEASIKVYIQHLRILYQYALIHKAVSENPFLRAYESCRKARAGGRCDHRAITAGEVNTLIEKGFDKTPEGIRDRCWCILLFCSGMRISEVSSLKIKDLYSKNGVWCLHLAETKTGQDDMQVLSEDIGKVISSFVETRLAEGALPEDYIFVHYRGYERRGARLGTQTMRRKLKYKAQALKLGRLTPHDGRATCVTLSLEVMSPIDAMQISRHKSLETLMIYQKRQVKITEHPVHKLKILGNKP